MARLLSLAVALAALVAAPVSFAAPGYVTFKLSDADFDRVTSPRYRQCLDTSGGVTATMRDCSSAEFDRLDRALNDAYRDAMSRLDAQGKAGLRNDERAWLKVRWRDCDRQAAKEEGGTLGLLVSDGCGISEMARRVLWLRQYGRR